MRPITKLTLAVAAGIVAAALVDQLRRPAKDRNWHGQLAGVPYDFRLPTPAHLRTIFWNPENPSLLTAHPFGVGWGLNLYRLFHRPL